MKHIQVKLTLKIAFPNFFQFLKRPFSNTTGIKTLTMFVTVSPPMEMPAKIKGIAGIFSSFLIFIAE
jgi:hypothetical protein